MGRGRAAYRVVLARAFVGLGLVTSPLAVVIAGVAPASAAVTFTVTQVESPMASGMYSPVDFNGSGQVSSSDVFHGINFVADSDLALDGKDASGHAWSVGDAFYGSDSPGVSHIATVRVMTSSTFLGKVLRPVSKRGKLLATPGVFPGAPRIVNASFTGSLGSDVADADELRRTDALAARDGVLIVAGAVSARSGDFRGATLIWGARNALAVRGAAPESVFDPSANVAGRRYANVWTDGTASVATGRVSSMAAALVGDALDIGDPAAARPASVRALLMASADRGTSPSGVPAWTSQLANGLDTDLGAGKADLAGARSILAGSRITFSAPTGGWSGSVAGPFVAGMKRARTIPSVDRGLGAFKVKAGQFLASLFRLDQARQGVTASLAWDTALRSAGATVMTGDIRLELRAVTLGKRGEAILSKTAIATVDGLDDNLRHLVLGNLIDAGLYAWVLKNEGRDLLSPTLAFEFGAVPTVPANTLSTTSLLTSRFQGLPPASGLSASVAIPEPAAAAVFLPAALLLRRTRRF